MKNKNDLWVFVIFFLVLVVVNAVLLGTGSLKWGWEGFGIMVAAAFTIGLYSFLYHDNPLFKLTEHFYVGVASAYMLIVTWYSIILPDIINGVKDLGAKPFGLTVFLGMLRIILPVLIGLLVYTRLFPKIAWLSKIPFSIMFGVGAGFAVPNLINAYLLKQLKPSMVPLWGAAGIDWAAVVIFVGVLSTLVYFFFSLEHKGVIGWIAKLGIWFLMVSFGASFGFTVMARISLLIGRVNFLFKDWIPLIQ